MLHGRGADEEDLIPLAERYDPSLLVIAVRAPFPWNGGYAWYEAGAAGNPHPVMFRESYNRLTAFLDDALRAYPVDPSRVALLGFSMGSVMSYALALTRPALFRRVIAFSGYIPEGTDLVFRWQELGALALFIAHGTLDPVIPVEFARRARKLFQASPADVDYREYLMGHEISEECLGDSARFLSALTVKP